MERQYPARPPDKKKVMKNERDTEGGMRQLTMGTSPRDLIQQTQTQCFQIENLKRCNPNGGGEKLKWETLQPPSQTSQTFCK